MEVWDTHQLVRPGLVGKLIDGCSNISLCGFGRWGYQIDGCPRFARTMEGLGVIGTLIAAAVRCRFALSEERLAVLQ